MNKRQRANRRPSEQRRGLGIPPTDTAPRRPLHGFEERNELTAQGQVWSRRLRDFIAWKLYDQESSPYIQVQVSGRKHQLPIWRAIVTSWLTEVQRSAILARVPPEHRGSYDAVKRLGAELRAIAYDYGIPETAIFGFLANSKPLAD